MKIALVVIFLLSGVVALAQPGPDTLWTRFYGWTGDDTAFSIQQTADGGFIIAGTATVPATTPYTKIFLMKTDSLGQMQGWHTYGDSLGYGAHSVVQTNDGGYAVAGYMMSALSYCLKVTAVGDTVWSYSPDTGWPAEGIASSIVQANDGGLVVALAEFPVLFGAPWIGLDKVSWNGGYEWRWSAGSNNGLLSHGLIRLANNSYAVTGTVGVLQGDVQAFFAHITESGSLACNGAYGGNAPYRDEAFDVVETPNGYLLAGRTSDGQNDGLFLCKLNASCEQVWIRRNIGEYSSSAFAMIPAIGGGYVICGTGPTMNDGLNMYLAKINDAGDIIWQRGYGTEGDEQAFDVIQTPDGGFVLCGYSTAHSGVGTEWYLVKTLPDPTLSSAQPATVTPQQYGLSAFPNPFNPTTTLSFALPKAGRTKIVVYDITGREVRMLSDEMFTAGEHTLRFDGSSLPSAIYFARMQSGKYSATRKLLLLK